MKLNFDKQAPRVTTGFSFQPETVRLIKQVAKEQGVSASRLMETLVLATLPDMIKKS